jgi:tetratricopeptide (TPR) repeat protein
MRIVLILLTVSIINSCKNTTKDNVENNTIELGALANHSYSNNKYVESIKLFSELIEKDSSIGEYYYKRGYCYNQIDSVEMSTIDYLKSVSYGYRLTDSYYNIGLNYLYEFRNYSVALKYFQKALELSPDDTAIKEEIDVCNKLLKNNKISI